jgi:hypothetical protein
MGLDRMIRRELPGKGVAVRRKGRHPTVFKVLKARRNGKGRPANDGVTMG